MKIRTNTKVLVSYRNRPPFGILPHKDSYGLFIYSKLGFNAAEVIGQFNAVDRAVVLLRQAEHK